MPKRASRKMFSTKNEEATDCLQSSLTLLHFSVWVTMTKSKHVKIMYNKVYLEKIVQHCQWSYMPNVRKELNLKQQQRQQVLG